MSHLFQLLADDVEVLPGVGHLEAGLLEEVLAVRGDEEGVVLRDGPPRPVDVGRLLGRRERRAVLLLDLGDDVRQVEELRLVEPGEVHAHLDQVVARLRLDLGGVLGRLLGRRDVVDLDLDARVLGEALADLGQLLVRRRGEVVPAEIGDLPLLAARGRNARRENAGEAGGGGQETAAVDRLHDVPPGGGWTFLRNDHADRPVPAAREHDSAHREGADAGSILASERMRAERTKIVREVYGCAATGVKACRVAAQQVEPDSRSLVHLTAAPSIGAPMGHCYDARHR